MPLPFTINGGDHRLAEKFKAFRQTSKPVCLFTDIQDVAVIVFFWSSWKAGFFASQKDLWRSVKLIAAATIATGIVGLLLKKLIEKTILKGVPHAEIELIFGNLPLISAALAAVGQPQPFPHLGH